MCLEYSPKIFDPSKILGDIAIRSYANRATSPWCVKHKSRFFQNSI